MVTQRVVATSGEVTHVSPADPQTVTKTTYTAVPQPMSDEPPQKMFRKKKTIFRAYQVLWYILDVVEVLLAFRFVFKLIGANPSGYFVSLIYSLSAPFAIPFFGIVPISSYRISVFEWSTLIGMSVYAIAIWGLVELLQLVKPVDMDEIKQSVDYGHP